MAYFLAKTDPQTYSIQDLKREGETIWDGVHNYQAINVIKSWQPGDQIFIYHSGGESRIVGLMEVVSAPYKDPHDKRGISWVAKVRFVKEFEPEKQVTLAQVKAEASLKDFLLVRNSRLSTMACPQNFIEWMTSKQIICQ